MDKLTPEVTPESFRLQITALTERIAGRRLDAALDAWLNAEAGPGTDVYRDLAAACQAGVAAGWLCQRASTSTPGEPR